MSRSREETAKGRQELYSDCYLPSCCEWISNMPEDFTQYKRPPGFLTL